MSLKLRIFPQRLPLLYYLYGQSHIMRKLTNAFHRPYFGPNLSEIENQRYLTHINKRISPLKNNIKKTYSDDMEIHMNNANNQRV